MKKSNEKLNILRDIGVYEYVAGDQSSAARAQFEEALKDNPELEQEVAAEQELRTLIAMTQPASIVSENNIDDLFKRIDADQEPGIDMDSIPSSDDTSYLPKEKNNVVGFAVAACLMLAVFFAVNVSNNNSLLEPEFETLTSKDITQGEAFDVNSLLEQNRLLTLTLEAPMPSDQIKVLLEKHQLTQLSNPSLNTSVITAFANTPIDDAKLLSIKDDQLIKDSELIK